MKKLFPILFGLWGLVIKNYGHEINRKRDNLNKELRLVAWTTNHETKTTA